MLKVDEASKELEKKSYSEIQVETAWKWGSRAAASYENCKKTKGTQKLIYWTLAEEYYHESVEHAALADDDGLIKKIRDAVHPYQEEAAESMGADPEKVDVV